MGAPHSGPCPQPRAQVIDHTGMRHASTPPYPEHGSCVRACLSYQHADCCACLSAGLSRSSPKIMRASKRLKLRLRPRLAATRPLCPRWLTPALRRPELLSLHLAGTLPVHRRQTASTCWHITRVLPAARCRHLTSKLLGPCWHVADTLPVSPVRLRHIVSISSATSPPHRRHIVGMHRATTLPARHRASQCR